MTPGVPRRLPPLTGGGRLPCSNVAPFTGWRRSQPPTLAAGGAVRASVVRPGAELPAVPETACPAGPRTACNGGPSVPEHKVVPASGPVSRLT